MFEHLTPDSRPRRRTTFALLSLAAHLALGAALVLVAMWEIEELGRPSRGTVVAAEIQPQGGHAAAAEGTPERVKPKLRKVQETRQPDARDRSEETSETSTRSGNGDGSGDAEGEGTGDGTGDGKGTGPGAGSLGICLTDCGDGPPPVPETKDEPQQISESALRKLKRISGSVQIQPPSSTRNSMGLRSQTQLVAIVQLCLDTNGRVNQQSMIKSSGYPDYDAKLLTAVRGWRYVPYKAGQRAIGICSQVTFVYQQEQ